MKVNLVVNYYQDKNEERQKELDFCICENLKNNLIDNVILIGEHKDIEQLIKGIPDGINKILPLLSNTRPTFNNYFSYLSEVAEKIDIGLETAINIIANLDIIIPAETIQKIKDGNCFTNPKTCLALTRWDMVSRDTFIGSQFFDRPDSQDSWLFKGSIPQMEGADVRLGIAGIDNVIAYVLEQNGYNVINPSKSLHTFHLHLTNIRNYIVNNEVIERLPPPYKLLPPTL